MHMFQWNPSKLRNHSSRPFYNYFYYYFCITSPQVFFPSLKQLYVVFNFFFFSVLNWLKDPSFWLKHSNSNNKTQNSACCCTNIKMQRCVRELYFMVCSPPIPNHLTLSLLIGQCWTDDPTYPDDAVIRLLLLWWWTGKQWTYIIYTVILNT